MTKATRIINKYHIKEMLLNGNPQFENFYKEELIQFCEVARELLKQYQKENQELRKLKTYFIDDTGKKLEYTLDDYMIILDINIQQNEQICELKKQLEEINKMIEKCGFVNIEQVMLNYCVLLTQQKEFKNYLENEIYSIEPKGTSINYNCEYDSEEDCVMAMQEQSRLNTLKEILQKYKEIKEMINNGV